MNSMLSNFGTHSFILSRVSEMYRVCSNSCFVSHILPAPRDKIPKAIRWASHVKDELTKSLAQ